MVYATKGNRRYVLALEFKQNQELPTVPSILWGILNESGVYSSIVLVAIDYGPAVVLKAAFSNILDTEL